MKDPSKWVETSDGWDTETHYRERQEQGFSKADWINFDTYIAWVIAQAVQKMKAHGHTMFTFEGEPSEKWPELTDAEYDVMITGFGNYATFDSDFFDDENYSQSRDYNAEFKKVDEDLQAALDVFKKRFRSLWD